MDNLAHALVGAALGRAVADRHVARAGLIGIVAANAPDWTELFIGLPGTRADYLMLHRGITHSLVGALLESIALTLLIGGIWRLVRPDKAPPWRWLALCIGAAIASHLFMEWQGSYGWRPFLPWNNRWYYLDWVAIVDPFFWLLPLVGLAWGSERHWTHLAGALVVGAAMTFVIARNAERMATWVLVVYAAVCVAAVVGWIRYWFGPVARQRAAALALYVLAVYAGAQGVAAQARKHEIRLEATRRFGTGAQSAALTEIGQPFRWEAIYANPDTVAGADWRIPRHLRAPAVVRAIQETADGKAMAQFARFLTGEVDSSGATVYLRDARYARAGRDGWAVMRIRME
jgi:inner membrane protein